MSVFLLFVSVLLSLSFKQLCIRAIVGFKENTEPREGGNIQRRNEPICMRLQGNSLRIKIHISSKTH